MKGKRIDNTLNPRFKDRITKKITIVFLILIFLIFSIFIFLNKSRTQSVKYYENGTADYNVVLSQNDFFKNETLPANNQYISSIIDTINVNFQYNLQMKNMFSNYKYKYRIEQQTKVIEKTTRNDIYNFKDTIKDEEEIIPRDSKFAIDNNVSIDYKKYDSMIRKIVSTYDLSNVDCKTTVTFYVDLLDENNTVKDTSTMSVNIPLNVKTLNIDVENNIDSSEEKIFIEGQYTKFAWIFLVAAGLLLIFEIINIKDLIKDIKRNCPQEIIDDIRLKRILKEYNEYIQRVNSKFDMSKYDMIKVEKFEDLLRIREIMQHPILMFENETKTKTYFIITTLTSIIYVFEINHGNVKELSN